MAMAALMIGKSGCATSTVTRSCLRVRTVRPTVTGGLEDSLRRIHTRRERAIACLPAPFGWTALPERRKIAGTLRSIDRLPLNRIIRTDTRLGPMPNSGTANRSRRLY